MKTKRIISMSIAVTPEGNTASVTTTNNQGRGLTKTEHHQIFSTHGRHDVIFMLSPPRPTVIRQLLFRVVDDEGNISILTKRAAKKIYGSRQVRKALKSNNR